MHSEILAAQGRVELLQLVSEPLRAEIHFEQCSTTDNMFTLTLNTTVYCTMLFCHAYMCCACVLECERTCACAGVCVPVYAYAYWDVGRAC